MTTTPPPAASGQSVATAETETGARAEALWAYSTDVYARPGVREALIAMQDGHGLDVNMLLLACWLAGRDGVALDAAGWRVLEAALGPWRAAVTGPLRDVRRRLGEARGAGAAGGAAALRARVLDVEVASERVGQSLLVTALEDVPALSRCRAAADVRALAQASLAGYLAAAGLAEDAGKAQLDCLLAAAFTTPDSTC